MSKALDRTVAGEADQSRDWRKGMSDTVAYSLLAYTGLHIFVTVGAIQETGAKSLAMIALIVLVFGVIPLWRRFEKRWSTLSDEQAHDPAYAQAYRRDQLLVWGLAIGLPVGLTMVLKALVALF
jgi:alpha-beta hydrolase superfamily lysophospholipase